MTCMLCDSPNCEFELTYQAKMLWHCEDCLTYFIEDTEE